jgi:hypothetical protein
MTPFGRRFEDVRTILQLHGRVGGSVNAKGTTNVLIQQKWRAWRGSNPRPLAPEANALSI